MHLLRTLAFVLAVLTAAAAATAAPAPGRLAANPVASDLDAVCGTAQASAADALSLHLARGPLTPHATPHSADVGEIAVMEDDGTLFFDLLVGGSRKVLDVAAASRAFYRTHGDDYDFLAFYCASGINTWLGSPTALAASYVVKNDTQGIGLDLFDLSGEFGGSSRLQCAVVMNGLHRYVSPPDSATQIDQFTPLDYLAHEIGHRWLSYVYVDSAGTRSSALLGRSRAHWSFLADVDASVMEGCSWAVVEPDSFLTDSVTTGFGALDLYLMGLAPKAETPPVLTVYDGTGWNPPGTYGKLGYPQVGVGCRGRAVYWTVDDVEGENGPRVPDAASAPHHFRVGIVLIVPSGSDATLADLAKLEQIRAMFGPYFHYATRGRGTVDVTLDSHAGSVAIAHHPLADTEDAFAPRPIAARIAIAQAGLPIALDPSSPRVFWRANAGPWNLLPLVPAGPDSFAAALPPAGSPGSVEYYFHAASDSAGIEAFDPPAGPAAPHAYQVGPDLTPPMVVHVPVRSQGFERVPQPLLARVTDNLGVDSVWVEFRVNGGALQSAPAAPAGADSFQVALATGQGGWIAYRFVARDAAVAGNLAMSNAAFDTMRVGHDWLLDFENGGDGFISDGLSFGFRTLWHLGRDWSSPAGGTSWKFGSQDGMPYVPHSGGYLYLPLLPAIEAGTMLRLDHRYGFEQLDEEWTFDGGYLEARGPDNLWRLVHPASGYPRKFITSTWPVVQGTPCWGGTSAGWKAEVFDLSSFAPGPALARFFVFADDFVGDQGWWLDHIRLDFPDGVVTGAPPGGVALTGAWPNPSRGELRQSLPLAAATDVDWALYDLQGRRVASLWRGRIAAGGRELVAALPARLGPGLYFSRITLNGRPARTDRVAVIR